MRCIPKKFLCCLSLNLGALIVGIVTLCLLILTAIVLLSLVVMISRCDKCDFFTWRNCYAYSITAFVYTLVMIALNLWFFHGVRKQKTSVVLTWIVAMAMWLWLVFVLLIVLISLYFTDNNGIAANIFCLVFGLIAIAILLYGWIVILAFWVELKESKSREETAP